MDYTGATVWVKIMLDTAIILADISWLQVASLVSVLYHIVHSQVYLSAITCWQSHMLFNYQPVPTLSALLND